MTDQAGETPSSHDARADTFCLSPDATIQAHIEIAKRAIASGENDLRRAAEHITKASQQGASQRAIAAGVGKSVSWVNGLLQWSKSGYADVTPFGPASKVRRERARVRANERTEKTKRPGRAERDEPAAPMAPRHPFDSRFRGLLVKALGMLGSDHVGERDNAARTAEGIRIKLGMTWDELVVPANGNDADVAAADDVDHQAAQERGR